MNNLAEGYRAVGKLDRALPLHEETLALKKANLGPDHPNTLTSMNNLAMGYQAAGKVDRALPLLEETLALMKVKLGPDTLITMNSMGNLASGYQAAGRLDRALPLLEETLALRKTKLDPDHPDTLISMGNLAAGYQAADKLDLRLGDAAFADRSGCFRASAVAMQRILVDHARHRRAVKRGGGARTVAFEHEGTIPSHDCDLLLDVDEVLARLAAEDPPSADVARHRLFAGLSIEEAAEAMGVSRATAFREWAYARSWLATALASTR